MGHSGGDADLGARSLEDALNSFHLPPPPRPGSQEFEAAKGADPHAKSIEQRALLEQGGDGVMEVNHKGGLVERVRVVFGGRSSGPTPDADLSEEDAWERERQRRRELEQGHRDRGA